MLGRYRILQSLVTVALVASVANAQSSPRPTFGVLIGGTSATFTNVDETSDDLLGGNSTITRRNGFLVGAYVNRALSGRFSVQPEVHYTQRGSRFSLSGVGSTPSTDITINLTYLEVPLLFRVDLGSSPRWRPFLTAGPTAALRIGCDGDSKVGGTSLTVQCKDFGDDGEDVFEKTDFGASLGAGVAGKIGSSSVFAQLRYGLGLSSVIKDAPSGEDAPKNSVFSLVFGIGR
jgi:hypothetical protein